MRYSTPATAWRVAICILLALHIDRAALAAQHPTSCTPAVALEEVTNALVTALNAKTAEALGSLVSTHWDETRLGPRRAGLLSALRGWQWRSGGVERVSTCGRTAHAGYVLLRNANTAELDSVVIDVDSATGKIRSLRIPQGGRVALHAADTASEAARVAALAALLRRLDAGGVFAGEVLLARDGKVLYHEAVGLANRETQRQAQRGEPYNIASVGKMFTATAIMKLAEEGRLSVEDSLGEHLPEGARPRAAGAVPLKYLLSHTSGITRGVDTLHARPGTQFRYDNYNFNLLAQVIERVTGTSFDTYFQTALFTPVGMTGTKRLVRDTPDPALPVAYEVSVDSTAVRFVPNPQAQTFAATGAGGMFSTADDLFRFAEALRTGRVLARETVERMRQTHPEWGAVDYGFGIDRQRGGEIWGHNGYIPGANADVEIYGNSGYILVALANMPANEPVRRLVAALLGA